MCTSWTNHHTVQGRPGMEAVDFLEKTTVAEHFGHLHELFIYDVRGCCRINPFDFTFSDLLPPRMPIWYPCMGSLIQQLCHSLWNDLLSKDYYEEEGLNRKREYLLRFWIKFYKSVKYHIYSTVVRILLSTLGTVSRQYNTFYGRQTLFYRFPILCANSFKF